MKVWYENSFESLEKHKNPSDVDLCEIYRSAPETEPLILDNDSGENVPFNILFINILL